MCKYGLRSNESIPMKKSSKDQTMNFLKILKSH